MKRKNINGNTLKRRMFTGQTMESHWGRRLPTVLMILLHISLNTVDEGYAINPGADETSHEDLKCWFMKGCQCITFTSTFGKERGTFHSPNYPRPYPADIDCLLYFFKASPNQIVHLVFNDFDVYRGSADCTKGDYVKVFTEVTQNGELDTGQRYVGVNEYSNWSKVLCGPRSEKPPVVYSAGPALALEFHSGKKAKNNSSVGFIGTFGFVDKRLFETTGHRIPSTECDYTFASTRTSNGRFFSPLYPSSYPNNVRCGYSFYGRPNEKVKIVFEELSLETGDESCLNRADIIKVYDGKNSTSTCIAMLCNELLEYEVLSKSSDVFIEFIANSGTPGQGFKATYQFESSDNKDRELLPFLNRGMILPGPEVRATTSSCHKTIHSENSKRGKLISPNFPKQYPVNSLCYYELIGRGKERVQLFFKHFDLYRPIEEFGTCDEFDSLQAFLFVNGRIEKSEVLCGNELPLPIMSNAPRIMLEFRGTLSSPSSKGFEIYYEFVENFGLNEGKQLAEYPCAFVFNSSIAKAGFFTSPNHPGTYPRDTECSYFFHGEESERLVLDFSYFDIEGVLPCESISSSDYLEFSNYMVKDKKFGRYCGRLKEFRINSDRNFFKVVFKSNQRLDGTGFKASYQFYDENLLKPPDAFSQAKSNLGFNHILITLAALLTSSGR